jgi:hypothetical protein
MTPVAVRNANRDRKVPRIRLFRGILEQISGMRADRGRPALGLNLEDRATCCEAMCSARSDQNKQRMGR